MKRYSISTLNGSIDLIESPHGDWVLYVEIRAELDRLRAELETARANARHYAGLAIEQEQGTRHDA